MCPMVMNLFVSGPRCPSFVNADFTKNNVGDSPGCLIFDGSQITFNTTKGTINPTTSLVTDGIATSTLYEVPGPYTVCATTGTDLATSPYTVCTTPTPLARVNIYVSPSGDDSNDGLTTTTPVKTISTGDTFKEGCEAFVFLEAGATFSGTGNTNITITEYVTLDRYGLGADPIIDLVSSTTPSQAFIIESPFVVSISNIVIKNGFADLGGAIQNNGILFAYNCTFSVTT